MKTNLKLLASLSLLLLFWVVACKEKVAEPVKSTEKTLLTFAFSSLSPAVDGTVSGSSITATVPFGTDLTKLVATITLSPKATVSPASGVAQDFTNPVTYTVTAEDGTTTMYLATVNVGLSPLAQDKALYPAQQLGAKFLSANEYQALPAVATPGYAGGRLAALPKSFDLSADMPPVGNQGAQGSCVGWAAGYALRSYLEHYVSKKSYVSGTALDPQTVFSPAFVYNQLNGGKDEGTYMVSALRLMLDKGAVSLADMPYSDRDFTTQPSAGASSKAFGFRLRDWGRISLDLLAMKAFLANKNPILIGAKVDGNMTKLTDRFDGELGWRTFDPASVRGGHAMVIVGYDDDKAAFKVQNSWGTGWGNKGYFWMAYTLLPNIQEAYTALVTGKNYVEVNVSSTTLNDVVYFGSGDNSLYAIDAKTAQLRWRFMTGKRISTTPAYANGLVYTTSQDSKLYAIDAKTGQQKWVVTNVSGYSSPTVYKGLVYLGVGYKVIAYDAATGETKWEFDQNSTGSYLSYSDLNVVNDVVFASGQACCTYSTNTYFYALDAKTGAKKWQTLIPGSTSYGSRSSVSVADGLVYIGAQVKGNPTTIKLLAYTLDTGEKKWEITQPEDTYITGSSLPAPAVTNSLIFSGTPKSFQALDAKTGAKKWEFTDTYHDSPTTSTPFNPSRQATVVDGIVYLCNDNYTYALNALTGKRIWRLVINYTSPNGPPTPANGVVYVNYTNGAGLQAIDVALGAVLWGFKVDSSGQPCVVDKNGKVYRGSLAAGN